MSSSNQEKYILFLEPLTAESKITPGTIKMERKGKMVYLYTSDH